jgi:hypothetical protein
MAVAGLECVRWLPRNNGWCQGDDLKVSARTLAYRTFLGPSPGTTCLLYCTAGRELLSGTQKVSDPGRGMEGLGKDKGRPQGRARAPTVAVTGSGEEGEDLRAWLQAEEEQLECTVAAKKKKKKNSAMQ